MQTAVAIRTARTQEFREVGELTVAVYVGEGLVPAGSDYVSKLADAAGRGRAAQVLVAVEDGVVLGAVTLAVHGSTYAEIAGPGEAEIRMLAVLAAARGRGVGEALVRACLDGARAQGATLMRLSTQTNMQAAHRIYQRLGFARTPQRDWSPVPGVDLITYELPLARSPLA